MKKKRRCLFERYWLMNLGLLLVLPGCQPTMDPSGYLQDFARQALAAVLL